MENLSHLISQLEAAHTNISDVSRKLKLQILDMENQAQRYDFISREIRDRVLNEKNKRIQTKITACYRRMISHELGLVQETAQTRFENICRNAQMQMEGLLAYFYQHQYGQNAQYFVAAYNDYVTDLNNNGGTFRTIQRDRWDRITFSDKYFLFQQVTRDADLTKFIKILNKYRNSISHVGYENRANATVPNDEVSVFARLKDVNAVLDSLEKLREYVEYNTI